MARRLLLVDDSSTMRRMIAAWLQQEGYEVATACDGREGLEKAREFAPEMIVTDFEMPELDGPGLCRALKADEALRSIPVLMLTTLGGTESKVQGLDAGADDYVEKPKSPDHVPEIFARIRAQLRIADLRGELAERNRLLEQAQSKLELELNLARKVQLGLMPRPPKPRGVLRLAVSYQPANQLGGDLYDFARLDGGKLGVLVVDISGHGVNSALLSGMVKTAAAPLMASGMSPAAMMAALDAAVVPFFPDAYFFTAFYLIFDEASGAIDYVGVGHPPVLIVGEGGTRELESDAGLMGMGFVDELAGGTDTLAPGEVLLVYTDGLSEAMDAAGNQLGTAPAAAILRAHLADEPAAIVARLEEAVAAHTAPARPHDDINMIVVKHPAP
jgi:sigma-B regulation protein RsbU (phosphoserine phosphatase)